MKKITTIILAMTLSSIGFSQDNADFPILDDTTTIPTGIFTGDPLPPSWEYINHRDDCGTWESDGVTATKWVVIDTLSQNRSDKRNWVYSDKERELNYFVNAGFAPCGRGTSDIWVERRVCTITGIHQERQWVETYTYVSKPLSVYERTLKSF